MENEDIEKLKVGPRRSQTCIRGEELNFALKILLRNLLSKEANCFPNICLFRLVAFHLQPNHKELDLGPKKSLQ